jgi:hypothetical protein
MAHTTIQQALQHVADHPRMATDVTIDVPVHELVARALFEIANSPDEGVRGSMTKATKAQRLILDRMVGTRRPGSHPAARKNDSIDFVDLTEGVLES